VYEMSATITTGIFSTEKRSSVFIQGNCDNISL